MKYLLSFALAFVFSMTMMAQNIVDTKFNEYKALDNYTSVKVSAKMFELAGYIEFDENDAEMNELKDFIETITAFNMIAGRQVENPKSHYELGIKTVSTTHEELMRVDDKAGSFTFFIDETKGLVHELVMVGTTEAEFIVFSLTGKMNLRDLSKMTSKMQNMGFSKLDMIEKHGAAHLEVYPNPSSAGDEMTIKVPEHLMNGEARLYDMNGKAVKNFKIQNNEESLNTSRLQNGNYILEITKDGVTMKKRVVIQA